MRKIGFHLPLNALSFGSVSLLILRTLFDYVKINPDDLDIYLFTRGPIDIGNQSNLSQDFGTWLNTCIKNGLENWSKKIPIFNLWHLNGGLESYSQNQTLLTFHELDSLTKIEKNVCLNNRIVLTSQYSRDIFKLHDIETEFLPLPFDDYNFKRIEKRYHSDNRITFSILGKSEQRKFTKKTIQAWIKKYVDNPKYSLQCAIFNPFFSQDQNNQVVADILQGKNKPFNLNFYPQMRENSVFNDFLNSANIVLGMSGGESWGLGEFHSVGIGKHAVLLLGHAYKTWATKEMVTFIEPSGKQSCVDNIFFQANSPYNNGQIFSWDEDGFIAGMEEAVKKVESNPINVEGLKLQTKYPKEEFLNKILQVTLG